MSRIISDDVAILECHTPREYDKDRIAIVVYDKEEIDVRKIRATWCKISFEASLGKGFGFLNHTCFGCGPGGP